MAAYPVGNDANRDLPETLPYGKVRKTIRRKERFIATTTMTSKGQLTLPKEIRERLKLKPGDRLEVATDGNRIVMTPAQLEIGDLCSILPAASRVATLDEIDAAIRFRARRRRE
jgi:AbrB family looped-hinge helix DNA binding protein